MTRTIPVTYVFCRSCPSHEEGLGLLRAAAEDAGVGLDLEVVEVRDDDHARAIDFAGSPSYIIAGVDPFPRMQGVMVTADACRAYTRSGGRIGPLPESRDLEDALRGAAA